MPIHRAISVHNQLVQATRLVPAVRSLSAHISRQTLRKPFDGTPKATKAIAKIIELTTNVKTCVSRRMARMMQVIRKNILAFFPFMEAPTRNCNPDLSVPNYICFPCPRTQRTCTSADSRATSKEQKTKSGFRDFVRDARALDSFDVSPSASLRSSHSRSRRRILVSLPETDRYASCNSSWPPVLLRHLHHSVAHGHPPALAFPDQLPHQIFARLHHRIFRSHRHARV